MNNTVLILLDGMRPDSLDGISTVEELKKTSSYSLSAETVFPSVTLPCHMSLFHSVDPQRHGITTNTYVPQVRPIRGLCEVLKQAKKRCAIFYTWEELRDLTRPDSLAYACFCSGHAESYSAADSHVCDHFCEYVPKYKPDFTFLYLGLTDEAGHGYGWMSEKYLAAMRESWSKVDRALSVIPDDWNVIITADHGGHDRSHGTTAPEDMTIPVFFRGPSFEAGRVLENVSIKDIAPTIASLLGVEPDDDWEGGRLSRQAFIGAREV